MNELATLETLHKIEQSKLAIREVKNLDEIKTLIDQSEALKAYAKSAQLSAEIQADIAELNRRATRRLGEISAALEKAKCERTDLYRRTVEVSNSNTEKISKTAMLSSVGVDIRRANEAEKIASIPEDVFDGILKSSKSGVSKADIAELAKIEPERQKAVAEKLAAGESASIAEAQRKLQQEESARKQSEEQQAHARVSAYLKTGKKPEGWREGTDDKLAQEEQKRQARVDAVFAEARKKQEERQAEDQKYEEDIARLRAEREKAQAEYAKERTEGFNTESLVSIHAPAWSATSVGKFPADKKYRLKPTKNREETAKADAEKRKASDREDSGAFRFLSDAAGIDAKVLRLILLVIPAMFIDLLMPICFYWGFKDARS